MFVKDLGVNRFKYLKNSGSFNLYNSNFPFVNTEDILFAMTAHINKVYCG